MNIPFFRPRTITKAWVCAHYNKEGIYNVPKGAKKIAADAFYCSSHKEIKEVNLPDTVTEIGERAFRGCDFKTIKLPANLTKIAKEAFSSCWSLESITIPDGITEINHEVFEDCYNLKEVRFPSKISTIGIKAFSKCPGLKKVYLPKNLKEIKPQAFDSGDKIVFCIPCSICPLIENRFFKYNKEEQFLEIIKDNTNQYLLGWNWLYKMMAFIAKPCYKTWKELPPEWSEIDAFKIYALIAFEQADESLSRKLKEDLLFILEGLYAEKNMSSIVHLAERGYFTPEIIDDCIEKAITEEFHEASVYLMQLKNGNGGYIEAKDRFEL